MRVSTAAKSKKAKMENPFDNKQSMHRSLSSAASSSFKIEMEMVGVRAVIIVSV
jgi:hypothetical protein